MRDFLWGRKMPLPNILEFIGTNITQRKFQEAQEKLLNYLGIDVPTKTELNSEISKLNDAITPKADKTYVDSALTGFTNGAAKFYSTLAEANADIANIKPNTANPTVKDKVDIGEIANGGTWYKATSGATSLNKSPYDAVEQAKVDATTKANAAKVYAEDLVLDTSNTRNLIIDTFFKDADNSGTWLGRLRSTGLTFIANEKFDFGKTAVKADNTTFNLELYLDELQAASFEVAMLLTVIAAKNIYINASYFNEAGQGVQNVPVLGNKALVSGDNTVKCTLTPPAYASRVRLIVGHLSGATGIKLHAIWAANINVPDLPVVPYSKLSKAVTPTTFDKYSASSITTAVDVKDPSSSSGTSSIYGFGCDLTPSADFNALQFDGMFFDENAKYLVVNIYSSPDIASNPLNDANGTHVSRTMIELDSKAKRVKNLLVPTLDPKTSALKTVTTAMLGARYCIAYETQDKNGALVANVGVVKGTLPNAYIINGRYRTAAAWTAAGSYVLPIGIRHVNANNIELKRALNVKDGLDEFNESALIVPKKIYGFVGAETSLYFDNITQDKNVDFAMLFPSSFVGLRQFERWMYKPTAAGETSFTISSSKAGFELDSQTVAVKVVADNAVNATKKVHFIGDSLIEYGDKLKALYDLQAANTYTKLNFVGTRSLAAPYADVKHNGYAGKSIDQLFTATIPNVGTNPFFNTATSAFDYSYFLTNSLIDTPDFVFIGFGPNDMSSIITDGMAIAKAKFICDYYQRMIDSIKTASSAIKVVIAASVPSGDDADGFTTAIVRGEQWRMNRNLKILAKEVYSRFGTSEASGIYVSHASCSFDTKTGYRYLGRAVKNSSIKFDTYATYAAMIADLSKTDRTVAYATDVADYFVKVGGTGVGTWVYATERDGIVRRLTDSVHYNAAGGYQHALVDYSIIKCVS